MKKASQVTPDFVIPENLFHTNTLFLGERKLLLPVVKSMASKYFESLDVFAKREVLVFEVEKLNISVDDIRRMISFANRTHEGEKLILLSSFYWSDEAQNAMLKVLEETPSQTHIFIFGLNEKTFLKTILSRVQKANFKSINSYYDIARETLSLHPNSRLESKNIKKILSLKAVDYNYEKDTETEKKDREAHIMLLSALMDICLEAPLEKVDKKLREKILTISTLADIEGGSPHLFIEWLLLSSPQV